jgi:hypothetical protein
LAVSRPAVLVPQVAVDAPYQSSSEGAAERPGVHSVLKKLWLAPMINTELLREVSSVVRSLAASVYCCPCRSLTSPSQYDSSVTVGT